MQTSIRTTNDEASKQQAQSTLEVTRLAQQNHLSVMHSRFVNEKISSQHLNKNKVDKTTDSGSDTVKDDDFDYD